MLGNQPPNVFFFGGAIFQSTIKCACISSIYQKNSEWWERLQTRLPWMACSLQWRRTYIVRLWSRSLPNS